MNILQIDSSALGDHSATRQMTSQLATHRQRLGGPRARVTHLDLNSHPLAHWTPDQAQSPESQALLQQFLDADEIIVGAPMYNFSIPSNLKAWVDRIAVAGKTFRYTESGPEGLAGNKRLWIVSGRGGNYPSGSPMDFQETYLKAVFGFLGITDIHTVRAEGLAMGEEARAQSLHDALAFTETVAA